MHRDLVTNMLQYVDSRNYGILDWASYLHAITLIRPYDDETKVDSLISTVAKPKKPTKALVRRLIKDEQLNESDEEKLLSEKSIDFKDFRMMCL